MAPHADGGKFRLGSIASVILIAFLIAGGAYRFHALHVTPAAPRSVEQVGSDEPAIGWIDHPLSTMVGTKVAIDGWALAKSGIEKVEVRFDGVPYVANFGIKRTDVDLARPGFPDSKASGFTFEHDFAAELADAAPVRHELLIVAFDRRGNQKVLGTKYLVPDPGRSPWRELYVSQHMESAPAFFVAPALSGLALGGGSEIDSAYRAYLSPTFQTGMRVPILYVRTTKGAQQDWEFDPEWNIEQRCGDGGRIAEDSLGNTLRFAIEHQVPVLVTLNGGIWASAGCDTPQWDVTDHLRADPMNCQWNERNAVMPRDFLGSPALSRSLTFNVYASSNRYYKKKGLQSAGRIVATFAREHPHLFLGAALDADTYLNPFFEEKQWYDYNPNTLKQFRQWLQGSGPYAGKGGKGVPDLRPYRRAKTMTLEEVNELSGRHFMRWEDVDPPRTFPRTDSPFWKDPWTHEWEVFRRHLVDLHYDELSQWLADAGVPTDRIYSSEGFMGPVGEALPFAIRITSPTKNYDSGGMSVEGAIPKRGHLGAIVYGPGAANDIAMETPYSLFATFHKMDPGWIVGEINTADLRNPNAVPTYATAYRSFVEMFNYGARLVSPMAWNGSNGLAAGSPGYVSYTAWRNTPFEDAMLDFAVSHAYVPLGARLWTFGTARAPSTDGWAGDAGTTLVAGNGHLDLRGKGAITLLSPTRLAIDAGEINLMVLGVDDNTAVGRIEVEAREGEGPWLKLGTLSEIATTNRNAAGLLVPLQWPAQLGVADQFRVQIRLTGIATSIRLSHAALYPPAAR
jgi:hypothetical protein